MQLLRRFFGPKRTTHVVVYALVTIVDGNAKANPVGNAPRFSDVYEDEIRVAHNPASTTYLDRTYAGLDVILCWGLDGIDAVSTLSIADAESFPGFVAFPADVLAKLDPFLRHFPRPEAS